MKLIAFVGAVTLGVCLFAGILKLADDGRQATDVVEKPAEVPVAPTYKVGDKVVITTGRGIASCFAHGVVSWVSLGGDTVTIIFVDRNGQPVKMEVNVNLLSHE